MTISTVVRLTTAEKDTIRATIDILHEIVTNPYVSDQCSSVYYSGGYFDHLDLDELSEMEQMLDDLANAKDLELVP